MRIHFRLAPVWVFLASMPVGLALFVAVAVVSIVGSVVPAWASALYQSWWFAALIGALVLNTGLCTVRQAPGLVRGTARVRILFVVHFSVLVVALGCFWGTFAFQSQTVTVRPGETFAVGEQNWSVDTISVQRYPDGTVSDWVTTLVTPSGPRAVRVNHTAEWGDDKVLQSGYGREFSVQLEADGQSHFLMIPQDTEVPLTADGRVGLAVSPPRDGLLAAAQDDASSVRTVDVLLTSGGRILQQTAAFEGVPLTIGDTGLSITVVDSVPRSTLLVRHTPGLWLVWVGLALLALSVTTLMLMPRRNKEAPHA